MNKPEIRIEEIDEIQVIYIRFRGTYIEFRKNARKMFNKLFKFASDNNLIIEDVTKVLTIYHDNPFITNEKDLRTSVAMTVSKNYKLDVHDEISIMTIKGKFVVGKFTMSAKEYGDAWKYMYNDFLFKSNYTPRDSFPFEMYITEPPKNLKDTSITEIYIPIE